MKVLYSNVPKRRFAETRLDKAVRKFLTTDLYYVLIVAIVTLAWALKNEKLGFIGLIGVSSIVLLFADDVVPLTINIFAAFLMIYDSNVSTFLYLWPTFIPLGIALAVFVARNAGKRPFRLGKMFFPQLAVSVALLLGGVGFLDKESYVRGLPNAIALGIGVLAVYLLYANFAKRDEKRDYGLMTGKMLMYIGIAVCVELVIAIMRSGITADKWDASYWDFGWGNRNNIATFLLFSAPMCFYLATRYAKSGWLYMLVGILQYVCLILTFSRGGILFGAIGAVFALAFTIIKSPSRKQTLISLGVYVVIFGVAAYFLRDKISGIAESLIRRGTGLSGRDLLYEEGVELFKQHPIFGVGIGYIGTGPCPITTMQIYLYHSTAIQIIASTGAIGIAAYAYYYATRFYLLFRNGGHKFNLFMLAVWIGFEGYSMMDTGTFVPFPNMMLVIILTFILEINPSDKRFEGVADEYNSLFPKRKKLAKNAK